MNVATDFFTCPPRLDDMIRFLSLSLPRYLPILPPDKTLFFYVILESRLSTSAGARRSIWVLLLDEEDRRPFLSLEITLNTATYP